MRTRILLLIMFLFSFNFFLAQDIVNEDRVLKLKKNFEESEQKLNDLQREFEEIKASIEYSSPVKKIEEMQKKQHEIIIEKEKTDSIYDVAISLKSYMENFEKVNSKELEKLFSFIQKYSKGEKIRSEETKEIVYLYFGPDQLIKEKDLEGEKERIPFIENMFNIKSEAYLGDFKVSQKDQLVSLYKRKCRESNFWCNEKIKLPLKMKKVENTKDNDSKDQLTEKNIKFEIDSNQSFPIKKTLKLEKILLSIHEGSIKEAKVILKNSIGNELLYENKYPISLLRYSSVAPKTSLIYKASVSLNKNEVVDTAYVNTAIRFSDILMYIPNPGENYVPDDLSLVFPQKEENASSNITYKVIQDTSLKNVLELRTYTDLLGLFGKSDNGLVQFEGKAVFYVNPFNVTNSRFYFLKKVVPYVNFSRLDNDKKYLELMAENNQFAMQASHNSEDIRLQSIEKAFLDMGLRHNLFSYAFSKESPFSMSVYIPIRFLITNASMGIYENSDTRTFQLKSFGLGAGLNLEFRKFNNFILTYNLEYTQFKFKEFNVIKDFITPNAFYTFTNEAEVSYYPGKQKNQSAFVRFRVVTNSEKDIHDSFYQLHFGYRFTIPLGNLKK